MKVTLNWLKHYVDFDWPPDELREQTGHKSLEDAFVALAGLEHGEDE